MTVVFYSMAISHPCQAVRKMLELKGIDYELVNVTPSMQRLHLRLAGFRAGTVPAMKIDGRRVQGSLEIARELDRRWPEPPLFPADPEQRRRVEEAERWGEERLQPIPRRLFRFGLANHPELVREVLGQPTGAMAAIATPTVQLASAYYARTVEADGRRATEGGIRADLTALPGMLDRVDRMLADGTLTLDPPNAATLQVLSTVRVLGAFEDLRDLVAGHQCLTAATELLGAPHTEAPRFLDPALLASAAAHRDN